MLGSLQVDVADNLLLTADFCRIFTLINKYIIRVPLVRQKVKERRDCLLRDDFDNYCKLVHEVNEIQVAITVDVKSFVCTNYQIDEETFQANYEKLIEDQEMHDRAQVQMSKMKV